MTVLAKIISHSRTKKLLLNVLNENRVAHAYLFHGPQGVGKRSIASAFAAGILCPESTGDACGTCSVCTRVLENKFPDFSIMAAQGNNIKIEQIRELQRNAQFKPYAAGKKVYIIDGAEHMTRDAANCLLRILEDPPPDTVFLLITANLYSLLPTIISRCQMVSMTKAPAGEIEQMLIESRHIDPEKARLLALLSDGLPGKALEMAGDEDESELRKTVFQLNEKINLGNVGELLKTAEELEKNREKLPGILEQMLLWYRDKLIWSKTGDEQLILNVDKIDLLKKGSGDQTWKPAARSIEEIFAAKNRISQNANIRLTLEVLLMRLAENVQKSG
ncbi:MAG: DNA polymerase III subunit delta' [Firmicutes bacterium HGW-Firmicutes-14]|nr:MAG: DNA polymerase III subunit delta' [Firmicutes bacterium HGW-Firmicutes-14]